MDCAFGCLSKAQMLIHSFKGSTVDTKELEESFEEVQASLLVTDCFSGDSPERTNVAGHDMHLCLSLCVCPSSVVLVDDLVWCKVSLSVSDCYCPPACLGAHKLIIASDFRFCDKEGCTGQVNLTNILDVAALTE